MVKTLACHARDEGIVTPTGRQVWKGGRAVDAFSLEN